MSIKSLRNEKGIGLVEVIFALGISVVVITALVSLSLFTLRSSTQSKLMLQATKFSSQETENVRALRDSIATDPARSWQDFIDAIRPCNTTGSQCYVSSYTGASPVTTSARVVTIGSQTLDVYFYATETTGTPIAAGDYPDVVRISVIATWDIGGQAKYVYNYTDLSNWRND